MKRRTLLTASAVVPFAVMDRVHGQSGKIQIVWWHAMTGVNADETNRLARAFSESQAEAEVLPIYKGGYADTLTAAIAAWRADQAPHLVQIFEVGTGSMLASGPATKQVWKLAEETGVTLDPAAYIPGVRGYYSLPDGRLASMPFNSSTAVMWYNKDAFAAAGLDPEKAPATWPEVVSAARAIKAKIGTPAMGTVKFPVTTSWLIWVQLEQYGAIHDLPFATKANGFEGLDAELRFNGPPQVKQWDRLLNMAKEGLYEYGGRDTVPDALFYSGQAAIGFGSSAGRGQIAANAKFKWAAAYLPFDPEVNPHPINSIIGGASLWTMTTKQRTAAEYKAVAQFLKFLAIPEQDAHFHQTTGYVPVTFGGYEKSKAEGYYEKQPGADIPIKQLARGTVTANSRGLRLGRLSEIRNILYEETEKALQGQQSAKEALDNGARRGDRVLREFQKSLGG
ncbi:MAG: sn-glycerol-3-phosphate ABC transporter substrate-binding protein UgpB [Acetobacteraceae bacterium]|jgi:sn-glycerol 3-phosphate transport system substrate-binding protein